MQVALNLGTININDQEVARFIQNKNIDLNSLDKGVYYREILHIP
jgi:hypothetical protein